MQSKGLVVSAYGGFFFVACEEEIIRCEVRGRLTEEIYPGDRVMVKEGMIEELLSRDNLLFRPKIANVAKVLLVMAVAKPKLDYFLLDKFLLASELENVKPVIVLNKTDLAPDFKEKNKDKISAYQEAGYDLHLTSVKKEENLHMILAHLSQGISVLAGPSGVGKSALLNKLIPGAELKTGEVSEKLGRGTHTTRRVELLKSGAGGWVADTPGFTSLEISGIEPVDLRHYYPEISRYTPHCKFSANCVHIHEPGCAVKDALAQNEIADHRYQSYRHFYKILEEEWKNKYD